MIPALALSWAILAIIFCLRQAQWHRKESDYWARINDLAHDHPAVDEYYQDLLNWTVENKPGPFRCALQWQSPEVRRGFPKPTSIKIK